MRSLDQCRKYEVLTDKGIWIPVHWEQLDEGDICRCVPCSKYEHPTFVVSEHPHLLCEPVSPLYKILQEGGDRESQ